MRIGDLFRFASQALVSARLRTLLMLLAMSIGVSSVVLLTALGEGARRYVTGEFEELGTHLLIMLPGRSETTGGAPPLLGETPRDLTLQDALALLRTRSISRIAPITVGNAPVSYGSLEREVTVLGSTSDFFPIRHLTLGAGRPLPNIAPERAANVVVLGNKLKQELFGKQQALGARVRVGDRRFRVIGILADRGHSLGRDLGDIAIIPVAAAQSLFNTPALFRILIQARSQQDIGRAERAARDIIRERHDGEDDVTLITQDALLSTFDSILRTLTYTVGGIAAISLCVAGILIMNIMLIAVSQRTPEIGLLKALGAAQWQILRLFLTEAILLAGVGAAAGLLLGFASVATLHLVYPSFELVVPLWVAVAAVSMALSTGLIFGILPARRAATMDPIRALSGR